MGWRQIRMTTMVHRSEVKEHKYNQFIYKKLLDVIFMKVMILNYISLLINNSMSLLIYQSN